MSKLPSLITRSVRRILSAFARDEATAMVSAMNAALTEPPELLTARILTLQQHPEFEPFVAWISRQAPDLLDRFQWLVYGTQLELDKEARQPTFQELQLLIHLVREKRPAFLPFLREVVMKSSLARAAEAPASTIPMPTLPTESSSSCLVVTR